MSRIDIENAKAIRQAMNVVCGMEMLTDLSPVATSSDSYDNVNGDVYSVPVFVQYMDLSGEGFPNDGSAQPYEADHAGIIAQADADGQSSMELTVTFTGTPSALDREAQEATVYYYEGDKLKNKKLIFEDIPHAFPGTQTVTIESTAGRIQIARVSFGYSWWFDNDSLVSCNLTLRGLETRLENPELQLSQIEITGYEPENILDKAAMISDNAPIYYACGYPGDMSPVRKFYLSEVISWAENQITIRGEDATKFLDKDYAGKYVGDYNGEGEGGGLGRYITTVHEMLTDAGIEHEYINEMTTGPYANGEPFFIKNVSKRSIVAQAMNLFRFSSDWLGDCYVSYVDAGIPRFTATGGNNTTGWDIEDYTDLRIETQRRIKSVEMDIPLVDVGTSVAIETVQTEGTTIRELTDPYRTVAASSGTVSMITPYKYRLKASGNSNITGRPVRFYDSTPGTTYTPYKRTNASGVEAVVLSEFCGMENGASPEPGYVADFWEDVFRELLGRGIKTYSFTWRGDPRMQPRDYITLDIDGYAVDMTIESITLDHTDGGLTSQIVAREGFI